MNFKINVIFILTFTKLFGMGLGLPVFKKLITFVTIKKCPIKFISGHFLPFIYFFILRRKSTVEALFPQDRH